MAVTPSTAAPAGLRVHFTSVIVKAASVARSYPEGLEAFRRRFDIDDQDGELLRLPCMSGIDMELRLDQLEASGLRPGTDVAVCDMHQGPLLECDGIRFQNQPPGEFLSEWWAYLDPDYVAPAAQPTDRRVEVAPTAPQMPADLPVPSLKPGGPWRRVSFGSGPIHWIGGDDEDGPD